MTRAEILDHARQAITVDRAATHGEAEDTFALIAALWSADLGVQLKAVDVARLMVLFKLARAKRNPGHADSWVDMAGYAAIAGELAGMSRSHSDAESALAADPRSVWNDGTGTWSIE
jgi:hypothetical protein